MHGGLTYKGKTNLAFLWNVIIDRKTWFLLASKVSEARDINDTLAVFKEALQNSQGNKPQQILTDSCRAYQEGVKQNFGMDTDHIAKAGVNKPHANNNIAERLNETLRARTKVVRAWKKHKTQLGKVKEYSTTLSSPIWL
jgi:DDE domain